MSHPDRGPSPPPKADRGFVTPHRVSTDERTGRNRCLGTVFWLTGLPGAGKSTIAMGAERALFRLGYPVYVLDGDNLRRGLASDLGFSPADRDENIRRAGEVAALFADAGMIAIAAFISPTRAERARARATLPPGRFHEVFVRASLEACERRDPKGLYARARRGEIAEFTGVSAPYEPPEAADLVLDTEALAPAEAIDRFVAYCHDRVRP